MGGLSYVTSQKGLNELNKNLPVYVFGGNKDPVGQMGKGLHLLERGLVKAGNKNVRLKIYPNGRHRSEEHTSELQSRPHLVCRLLLEKKNKQIQQTNKVTA